MYLKIASKARIVVKAMGDVTLILDDSCLLKLKDSLYVLKYMKNLILVSSSCKENYSLVFFFNKQVFTKLNISFIYSRSLIDSLYHVSPLSILPCHE